MQQFQVMTCNLSKSKVRHETLDGKKYRVCPGALITEGVHKSEGGLSILYTAEQLGNMPSRWDHKPLVVYHPKENGKAVTACNPAVLESRGCGFFLNTHFDDKLRTEMWFDDEKTKKVDPRVSDALDNETLMEISTGLYMDIDLTPGEYKGVKYDGIAMNFAPDHVAILPDKVGACSIAAGGGMMRINEAFTPDQTVILNRIASEIGELKTVIAKPKEISVDKKKRIDFLVTNACGWEEKDRPALEAWDDAKVKGFYDFAVKAKEVPAPVVAAPVINAAPVVPVPVPRVMTINEYLAVAPPELVGPLGELIAAGQAEKQRLVAEVKAIPRNVFTDLFLNNQSVEVLRGLIGIAGTSQQPAPNYGGQATFAPVINAGYVQEPLGNPVIDWSK